MGQLLYFYHRGPEAHFAIRTPLPVFKLFIVSRILPKSVYNPPFKNSELVDIPLDQVSELEQHC
jgi:hypothetical protein